MLGLCVCCGKVLGGKLGGRTSGYGVVERYWSVRDIMAAGRSTHVLSFVPCMLDSSMERKDGRKDGKGINGRETHAPLLQRELVERGVDRREGHARGGVRLHQACFGTCV